LERCRLSDGTENLAAQLFRERFFEEHILNFGGVSSGHGFAFPDPAISRIIENAESSQIKRRTVL
jgi:hypothetical protein